MISKIIIAVLVIQLDLIFWGLCGNVTNHV